MFNATNSNAIISKLKNIFWVFFLLSGIYIKLGILWKRRWASEVISFWNYRLENVGLLKCVKSPVSEQLWTANMLKCPTDCLNLHGSIFFHFFWSPLKKPSSENSVLVVSKILRLFVNIFTPDDKYSLSVKASVYRYQFKCNYLKIIQYFLNFFLHFGNLYKIWNPLKQNMSLGGYVLMKLYTAKYLDAQKASCQNTYGQSPC